MSTLAVVVLATFFASCVEAVEAVTIVVGVGTTRGWRSVWLGTVSALVVLVLVVIVFGVALANVPIVPLRLVVGTLLLIFGLGWLRKGIRRVAVKGLAGDQFNEELDEVGIPATGVDWTAFVLAFKGVLLEGIEVAFIVVTFGAGANHLVGAAIGGVGAVIVVGGIGLALHQSVRRIPRSLLQLIVGVLLTTFGTFWAIEGLSIEWPGGDAAIPGLLVLYVATAAVYITLERNRALGLRPAA